MKRCCAAFPALLYPSVGAGAVVWCRACPQANLASGCSRVDRTEAPTPLGTQISSKICELCSCQFVEEPILCKEPWVALSTLWK